ncbi:cytochrome-c oxidase, cbb3-type subunit III [Dichotomicrobium thermohalophilum]|uniref:Cbb3-type cytochrome c oxidase subunit n=1 Tax=Dichotomicrobium thermohalophilum TaxID=933063 RepID=A0A397PFS1_9HYPH|nr:cytochrome-c oxidase, cbb3-type subunit III [Dichotomicrobium thermohalophilum]RIA47808.1 cytochrome c oxidase cbb3-type subunit 3 [Dichotomicrobium thermohalophilum]
MADKPERDDVTGIETTGHVWDDDLKELNKPLPKWWVYVFYVTIIWSIGYWILFPAWPLISSHTEGLLGYSQRAEVRSEIQEARAAQSQFTEQIEAAELTEIRGNPELLRFAMAGGEAAFGDNCAPCHGSGGQGFKGYPNLNDDSWIWGGELEDIHQTIRYGIRSDHPDARVSQMPRFGIDGILNDEQINDAAEYVRSLGGLEHDEAAAERGAEIFAQQCAFCHGENGKGMQDLGAPNLTDAIWLYGSSKDDIVTSIQTGRGGVMPNFVGRLDDVTIKQLAVYVHALGGGQ